ncbi:hypothetical protein ACVIWV_007712 [Bradyrhizobium diazoefficiens]
MSAVLTFYSVTADFESFCKQVSTAYTNTEWFLTAVAQRVKYGEVPGSTYEGRIERRHKTIGKLKQLAELVLELNDNHPLMSAKEYQENIDKLIAKLGGIQKEVSDDEMRHLLKVLSLENLHSHTPGRRPLDLFRSPNVLHRPRTEEEEFNEIIADITQDDDHVGDPAGHFKFLRVWSVKFLHPRGRTRDC